MKKNVLLFAFVFIRVISAYAQILNNSFETWAPDTNYLDLTVLGLGKDTSYALEPVNWTSSNVLTATKNIGNKKLVTQASSPVYHGNSAIKLVNDSVSIAVFGLKFNLPGFVVNGDFTINFSAFTSNFNIANLPGAGVPVNKRLGKVRGYIKYEPVGNDSCAVVSILKKGSTIVAIANYFHKGTDAGYVSFEAPYVYQSCLVPDTAIVLISSGNPYLLANLVNGSTSGLNIGSTLYADSISLADTSVGFKLPPIAVDDNNISVRPNTPKSITVLSNDLDCYGAALSVTAVSTPSVGSASNNAGVITYTPANNYIGKDSFTYTISNGQMTSTAKVRVMVEWGVGFNNITIDEWRVYPNPAQNVLHVKTTNPAATQVVLIDLLGQVLIRENMMSEVTNLNVNSLSNGIYTVQLLNATGHTLTSSKIVVSK